MIIALCSIVLLEIAYFLVILIFSAQLRAANQRIRQLEDNLYALYKEYDLS